MRFSRLFILLMALSLSSVCSASTELYRGVALVDDQGIVNQQVAMRKVLQDVLVKVSGSIDIVKHPAIRAVLKKSQGYVRQYKYVRDAERLQIAIDFEPKRINTLIKSAGFLPWTGRRPSTLLWLVEQNTTALERHRKIWAESSEVVDTSSVRAAADKRGVTVILPIMDLEEQQGIDANDVWGRFDSVIMAASERYFAGRVVSARLYQSEDSKDQQWQLDWRLLNADSEQSGQYINRDKQAVVSWLINHITDLTVNTVKQQNSNEHIAMKAIALKVNNLNSLKDYVQASNLLTGLTATRTIVLQSLSDTQAVFSISLASNVLDLQHELEMDGRLLKQKDEFGIPAEGLEFFWRP